MALDLKQYILCSLLCKASNDFNCLNYYFNYSIIFSSPIISYAFFERNAILNKTYADLHVHSTASDGTMTPTAVVELAAERQLKVMALTDHDTVAGVKEAQKAALGKGIEIIAGIELSCGWSGRDSSIHVLGLFIDEDDSRLNEFLNQQKHNRFTRGHRMVDKLEQLGFDMCQLREKFDSTPELVIGRPHVARYLIEKEYALDNTEVFSKFLGRDCPAYIPKEHVAPQLGIDMIHQAGGIAVLAHPGLIHDWCDVWKVIKDYNWDGFETYYSEHSKKQVQFFEQIVSANGWLSTGGSDFHGDNGKHLNSLGDHGLSKEQYLNLFTNKNISDYKKVTKGDFSQAKILEV